MTAVPCLGSCAARPGLRKGSQVLGQVGRDPCRKDALRQP